MKRLAEWCLAVSFAATLAACGDYPMNPSEPIDGPPARSQTSFQYCRMFTNPPVLMWTAPSTYGVQCPIQLTATPRGSFHVGDAALTYVFDSPVVDLSVSANRGFNAPCPTTPMTYTSYRQDGTIITQGQFTTFCNGANESIDAAWIMDAAGEPVKKLVVTAPIPMVGQNGTDFAIDIGIKYNVICPTTGNPTLDDAMNREKFDSSFQASNPLGPQTSRKEHFRAGYQFPDGRVESVDLNPPQATNCGIDDVSVPLTNGDGKLIWIWHSHPFAPGEMVAQCGNVILNPPKPYPGVPSRDDWKALDAVNMGLFANGEPPIDGFIWDSDQAIVMKHNTIGQPPQDKFERYDRSSTCQP